MSSAHAAEKFEFSCTRGNNYIFSNTLLSKMLWWEVAAMFAITRFKPMTDVETGWQARRKDRRLQSIYTTTSIYNVSSGYQFNAIISPSNLICILGLHSVTTFDGLTSIFLYGCLEPLWNATPSCAPLQTLQRIPGP